MARCVLYLHGCVVFQPIASLFRLANENEHNNRNLFCPMNFKKGTSVRKFKVGCRQNKLLLLILISYSNRSCLLNWNVEIIQENVGLANVVAEVKSLCRNYGNPYLPTYPSLLSYIWRIIGVLAISLVLQTYYDLYYSKSGYLSSWNQFV